MLLIFDEVISGFRCSPGGAQQLYGINAGPDHARQDSGRRVSGRRFGRPRGCAAACWITADEDDRLQSPLVAHQGTYNAEPVSAAAGIATLEEVRRTRRHRAARHATAAAIRDGINAAIRRRGLAWCAYGQFSDFHLYRGDETPEEIYAGKAPWQVAEGRYPAGTGEQDPGWISAAWR